MQLTENTLFDNRYILKRLIGRGGFSEVWLAEDNLTHIDEAIKVYVPQSGMDVEGLSVFSKELQVVHDLHHSALLTPKSLNQCDGRPYLVMQYCPNGSLVKRVGQVSEDEAWKIIHQVASGLAYLHQHGIVHQDIKPDNILVDANGDYVITDFGISLKAQSTLRKSMRDAANSGTMAYMAPERFSENNVPIPANDVWSLGAMMFELVEGDVPFIAQIGGLAQKNGADIPGMNAAISLRLKQLIRAMLSFDTDGRPTAQQLVYIPQFTQEPSSSGPTGPSTPQPPSQPQSNNTTLKAILIWLLIMFILIGSILYNVCGPNNRYHEPKFSLEPLPRESSEAGQVKEPIVSSTPRSLNPRSDVMRFYGTIGGDHNATLHLKRGRGTVHLNTGTRKVEVTSYSEIDHSLKMDSYSAGGDYIGRYEGILEDKNYSGIFYNDVKGASVSFSLRLH